MPTYKRNGHTHGHFDKDRFDKYDGVGRKYAKEFFENKGWTVSDFDKTEDACTIYHHPDLKAVRGDHTIYIEAAIKSTRLWTYIREGNFDNGVDVETRKLKYVREGELAYIAMSDDEGDNILLIPMRCLDMAQRACGDEYKGQGSVPSSESFTMPTHGCHRVKKCCKRGLKQTGEAEDFYRIPYEYVAHYRREGDKYVTYKTGGLKWKTSTCCSVMNS